MIRVAGVLLIAAVLGGCSKAPAAKDGVSTGKNRPVETTFVLAAVCPDGERVYRLQGGELAQWAPQGDGGYFMKFDTALTAEAFCAGHPR